MQSNFLSDYREFTSGNEAHPNYHIWSGLVALSSIISRRVWINFGHFNIYPNLFCVLLGPPGNKKTFAMDIAKDLLVSVNSGDLNKIPFSSESQSKEQLVKKLASYVRKFTIPGTADVIEYAPISIFVTELSQFLGTQTAAHMLDFLTTVWSAKNYTRGTLMHGDELIPGPYVTMLACTTPEWITGYLKTDIITGGFSRRVIFVYEPNDGEPIPFPTITEEQVQAFARAKAYAVELLNVGGPFQWDPEAKEFYGDWYIKHQKNLPGDESTKFYYKTKWVSMLKVATLINLAGTKELILRKTSIEASLALHELTEKNLPKVFQGIGRNELSTISSKVLDILLVNQGPVPRKKVESILWKDANGAETYNIIQQLLTSEKLYELEEERNGVKRTWLCLPEHIEKIQKEGVLKKR